MPRSPVREAIGQLFSYRYFLYREHQAPEPRLIALFSQPVGAAFVKLLTELGIASIWLEDGTWRGSEQLEGLAQDE